MSENMKSLALIPRLPAGALVFGKNKTLASKEEGFGLNESADREWLTDRATLFRRADLAVPEDEIYLIETHKWAKKNGDLVPSNKISKVWNEETALPFQLAVFIGCAKHSENHYAVLRAATGDLVTCNPWKLSFAVRVLGVDSLAVRVTDAEKNAIRLRRGEEVVGLLMPTKISRTDLAGYDFDVEPTPLDDAIARAAQLARTSLE